MKKTGLKRRIVSFILSLCMVLPCFFEILPLNIFAEGTPDIYVTLDGGRVEEILLHKDEKLTLRSVIKNVSVSSYGWQVLDDSGNGQQWVNIYDKHESEIEISAALFKSVTNAYGESYLRAVGETEFGRVCSVPVRVLLTDPEEKFADAGLEPLMLKASKAKKLLGAAGESAGITITINYLDAENPSRSVYSSYTATLTGDSTFSQTVLSPTHIGYAPFWTGNPGDVVPADNSEYEITLGTETRTYTYDAANNVYVNNGTSVPETDADWISAIMSKVIEENANLDASTVTVSFDPAVDEFKDTVINVYYKAIEVPYSVRYYFQNINDDGYSLNAGISYSGMAKTGTIVSDEELYAPVLKYFDVSENDDYGFSPLYHYPESVAADGSTVFECYYDRNYYLIKFDMDGGYGVEPIYARFGASFVVTPPSKAGYAFVGWDEITSYKYKVYTDSTKSTYLTDITLNEEEYVANGSPSAYSSAFSLGGADYPNAYFVFDSSTGDGLADVATSDPHNFTGTIRAGSVSYKAIWNTVNTTYTIVYWAENADDNGYSYWGNKSVTARSATVLSDIDAVVASNPATGAGLTDAAHFTYDPVKTNFVNNDDIVVEGDGSTIVNVYYSRNTYDILFYDTSAARCYVEEHVHSAEQGCFEYDCTSAHVHTAECYNCGMTANPHTELCCSKEEHVHTADCRVDDCPYIEHTHTAACYTTNCIHVHNKNCCSLEYHDHTSGCVYTRCGLQEHAHTINSCYTVSGTYTRNGNYPISLATTPTEGTFNTTYTTSSGVTVYSANTNNGSPLYYRINGQYYALRANNANITYQRRTNVTNFNVTLSCGKTEHTHGSSCYNCVGYEHAHSVTCYPNATTTAATTTQRNGAPSNPANGQIYRRSTWYDRIIYYNGSWYQYNGSENSGTTISMNCGKVEHTHTGACCSKPVHDHTSGCNSNNCTHVCSLENGCIKITCGKTAHVHSDACKYRCGKITHTHNNSCCTVGGSYRGNAGNPFKLSATALENLDNAETVNINGNTLYYDSKASSANQYLYYKVGEHYYQLQYGTNTAVTYSNYTSNTTYYSSLSVKLTCTTPEHTHTDSCYNCAKSAHAHGDGTCNVAACTDPTHHTHTDECLGCGFEAEHVHTDACPKKIICDKPEHSHSDGTCRGNEGGYLVYKITAKYNADIHGHWSITGGNGTKYTSAAGYRWDPENNNTLGFQQVLVYIDRMPGMANEDGHALELYTDKATGRKDITMHYCVQTIPNDPTAEYINYLGEPAAVSAGQGDSRNYQFVIDYRRAGAYYAGITMDVDFIELEGFDRYRLYTNSGVDLAYANNTTTRDGTDDYFYYLRKQYDLSFYNYNADWGNVSKVYYEQNMNPYNPGEPPYPSSLEPNAYQFEGWYTTPECYPGTEFDWTAVNKMPAKDVKLYAHWVPVTHTVRFFETYDLMREYEATGDESLVYVKQSMPDTRYKAFIEHGNYVGSIPNPDKLLVPNPGGSTSEYDFNGWFVIENESKKAFTPLDMPITHDTNVFADWGSHTAQPYAVHYALNNYETDSDWLALLPEPAANIENREYSVTDGSANRTYICLNDGTAESPVYNWHRVISDVTRGYAYQGTTRTFAARAGETYHQLYDADIDFNDRYYPTPASHSITMVYEENSLEPVSNVFTFRYVYAEEVEYTVRYLDATTGEVLHDPKNVKTGNAVVTERFVSIEDYVPDAFYKQCILAVVEDPDNPGHYVSSPENVITFYYSKNETSARYTVHFLLQNADENSRVLNDSDYAVTFNEDGTYNFSKKFTESGSRIDGIADKNTPIRITPMDFAGFDLVENKGVYSDGAGTPTPATYSGGNYTITPVAAGTDLFLFYTREQYPYKVYYLLYGSPVSKTDLAGYTTAAADTGSPKRVLADTDGITPALYALYGTEYTATAKDIPGYVCVSDLTKTSAITPVAENNYIIFFYTREQFTAQYKVWSGGGGKLTKTNETIESGNLFEGSTATADPGYRFVGWFVDEDCTIPATYNSVSNPGGKGITYTDSTKDTADGAGAYVYPDVARLIPNGQTGSENNIFYARFDPLVSDLIIKRESADNEGAGDQVFVYEIKNNATNDVTYATLKASEMVTVVKVLQGEYTVTQLNDWSHRFNDPSQTVNVTADPATVTFNKEAVTTKWLNGNSPRVVNTKGAANGDE